jgi:LPS sulfotransferase NodH
MDFYHCKVSGRNSAQVVPSASDAAKRYYHEGRQFSHWELVIIAGREIDDGLGFGMNTELTFRVREGLKQRYDDIAFPSKSYLVLMSKRSGSTLLCAYLEEIGFGNPKEGFNTSRRALAERFGKDVDISDPHQHVAAALKQGTVNGVFGLKLSWVEFEVFLKQARQLIGSDAAMLTDAGLLEVFFPGACFVRLERRDKIKQAVSYARAMQTGIWGERVDESVDYMDYVRPAEYNRGHIEALLDNILAYDISWRRFLTENNLPCLEVWYEDLAADYVGTMTRVCDYLGVQAEQKPEPLLRKQSDAVSSNWYERFVQETPWLRDAKIAGYLQVGDFEGVFFQRAMTLARSREREVWAKLPYNRMKTLKQIFFRLKKRLGLQ